MNGPAAKGSGVLRWFLWLALSVAMLFLLVSALATFMITTERGTRWALALGERWLPPEISWQEIRGPLVGPLELYGLEYESASLALRAERVVLEWQPLQLAHKQVQIDRLHITGLHAELRPDTSTAESEPDSSDSATALDARALPFGVAIDTFILSGATVVVPGVMEVYDASLHLRGTPDAYSLVFAATAQAPEVPEARITLAGNGSLAALALSELTVESRGATLKGAGSVAWDPALAWQLNMDGRGIDPAAFRPELADLPGALSFVMRTDGTLAGGTLHVQAAIDTLNGVLAEQPVGGRLKVKIDGNRYDIPEASLAWGTLQADANLSYRDTLVAEFKVCASDLASMLPEASGWLSLEGTAHGAPAELNISALLNVDSLAWRDHAIEACRGTVDVIQGGKQPSRIDLTLTRYTHASFRLDSARVALRGELAAHSVQVDVASPELSLSAAAQGGWVDSAWRGDLEELTVRAETGRPWSLSEPAPVSLSTASIDLPHLCLASAPGRVCADVSYRPDGPSRARLELDLIPLERAQQYLPEGWMIEGPLAGVLQVEAADETLRLVSDLQLGPGLVAWPHEEHVDTVLYDPSRIRIDMAPDRLTADVQLSLTTPAVADYANVSARFVLPGLPPRADSGTTVDSLLAYLARDWRCSLRVENAPLALGGRHVLPGADLDGALNLVLTARSEAGHSIDFDFDLDLAAGDFRYAQEDDSLSFCWSDTYLRIHDDSAGFRGLLHTSLALADGTDLGEVDGQVYLPLLPPVDDWALLPDSPFVFLERDWACSLYVREIALSLLGRGVPGIMAIDGDFNLALGARGTPDGPFDVDLELGVSPGRVRVPVDRDTAVVSWNESYFRLHNDSDGVHGRLQAALFLADGSTLGEVAGHLDLDGISRVGQFAEPTPLAAGLTGRLDLTAIDVLVPQLADTRGEASIHTEVSGTTREVDIIGQLELTGSTHLRDLGIQLEDLHLRAEGTDAGIRLGGQVRSGNGSISLEGLVSRLPSAESPTRIGLKGDHFLAMATPETHIEISPDLEAVFSGDRLDVSGTMVIPTATIEVAELPETAVPVSPDVVLIGPEAVPDTGLIALTARVKLILGDRIFFQGFDLSSFLEGQLEVVDEPGRATQGRGELRLREGFYRGYGQNLNVDPGRLIFAGPLDNPSLDVLAYRRFEDNVKIGFRISGYLKDPTVDTYSDPAKTDDEVMSYILFGRSMQSGSQTEQMRASEAAAYLGGNILAAQAATRVGLDDARIEPGSKRNDAAFFAGKYLSPRLYVAYGTGIYESMNTLRVRYILSRHFTLQAETGTRETADIMYQIER